MQEEIERKTVAFAVNSTKMTARLLLKLIKMYLAHQNELPHGKQTVKQLAKHGQGMTNIKITDKNIKCFEKYAKKYGVDFALKKDITETPPKYLVFFKAKDNDAIMSAFKEFSADRMKKAEKPSVLQTLREQKDQRDAGPKSRFKTVDKKKHIAREGGLR